MCDENITPRGDSFVPQVTRMGESVLKERTGRAGALTPIGPALTPEYRSEAPVTIAPQPADENSGTRPVAWTSDVRQATLTVAG